MRFLRRVPTLVLALALLVPTSALSVGYERYHPDGRPIVQNNGKSQTEPPVWESLKRATYLDRVPALLDGTAAMVRDILGQFGVVEQKAP